jgi:3-hydroxyacyl-CoA dehydrogenase
MEDTVRVTIVGIGAIGRAWTISFLRAGCQVRIWDQSKSAVDDAQKIIPTILPNLARNNLLNGRDPAEVMRNMRSFSTLEEALDGAEYVQENTAEKVEVKRAIFSRFDQLADSNAILVSSTSGFVPSAFTEHLGCRDRCLVAHPLNPPYLIPAVDVVPSPWTSRETLARAVAFLRLCGQIPIIMKKEDPGFITIRLQAMMYHECWRLVKSGLASPEDIDTAIREGLGLRWSFIGPFETADLNAPGGIRDFVARFGKNLREIFPTDGPVDWSGELMDQVEAHRRERLPLSELRERQLWRDRRLLALAAHKNAQSTLP